MTGTLIAPQVYAPRLSTAAVELYLKSRGLMELYPDVLVWRGQADSEALRAGIERMLIITQAGKSGFLSEQQFKVHRITLRCVGMQGGYDDAEDMADKVDQLMLAGGNVQIGDAPALYVTWAGGGPSHILTDVSRRAHFQCSYAIPVASGL